jgi:hypothetical protein
MLTSFESLENKHKGERCFILGSAPSILDEDLSLLKNETVMIINHSYKLTDHGLFNYDYYVCIDPKTYNEATNSVKTLIPKNTVRFYSEIILKSKGYKLSEIHEPAIQIIKNEEFPILENKFPTSFDQGWTSARSVIFDASIIAQFLGFEKVYWLGADFYYPPNKDTHFFGIRQRRKNNRWKNRDPFEIYRDDIITLIKNIDLYFKTNNKSIINLSKEFKFKEFMETNSFETIVGAKDAR